MARLSARLYWGIRRLIVIYALLLVALAVLLTLARLLLPFVTPLRSELTAHLQQEYGLSTRIGGLDASWQATGPVLVAKQIDLLNLRDQRQEVTIGQARVGIDFWESLRRWKLVLSELALGDVRLTLSLDGEGGSPGAAMAQLANLFVNQIDRFSVENATLYLQLGGQAYPAVYIRDLNWLNREELHQGVGQLSLIDDAATYGARFVLRLTGSGAQQLDGQFYLDARQLDLTRVLAATFPTALKLRQARVNGQLWLGFDGNGLQYGVATLEDNLLAWSDAGQSHQLQLERARLQWQPTSGGWQLSAPELALATNGHAWDTPVLQLDAREQRLLMSLDDLELANLIPLLSLSPATRSLAPELSAANLSGRLRMTMDWHDWRQPGLFTLSGELPEVHLEPTELLPGLPPLQASFRLTPYQGMALLSGSPGPVDYRGQFQENWELRQLALDVNWQRRDSRWRVFSRRTLLETGDLGFAGAWQLAFPDGVPARISLYGEARVDDAAAIGRYLPINRLSPHLREYLSAAILAGKAERAQLLWRGPLTGFPYPEQRGILLARVPLQDGRYRIQPGWQPAEDISAQLLFVNDTFSIEADRARFGKLRTNAISADFGRLNRDTVLAIRAGFRGQAEDARDYLELTPLRRQLAIPLTELGLRGTVDAALQLSIPFNGEPLSSEGRVVLKGASLNPPGSEESLQQVEGVVRFENQRVWADEMSARLLQQPIRASFMAKPGSEGYFADVRVEGRLQGETLLQHYRLQSWLPLQGALPTSTRIRLVFPDQGGYRYTFDVDADLTGTRLALPPPLDHQPGEPGRLTLAGRGQEDLLKVTAVLPDMASGEFRWRRAAAGWEPAGARLHLGRQRPLLAPPPAKGLYLSGDLRELAVLPWLRWRDTLPAAAASGNSGKEGIALAGLDLQVARLDVAGMVFSQVRLVQADAAPWTEYRLTGERLSASVALPVDGEQPISVVVEQMDLPAPQGGAASVGVAAEPAQVMAGVPWLEFYCRHCSLDGRPLGEVSFELRPEADKVALNRVWIDMGHSRLEGGGEWHDRQDGSRTRLHGRLVSDSFEQLLLAWGLASPLSGAPGELTFDLNWQGAPYQFDLDSLAGKARADLQSGVLSDVSDKGARILSLFSVDSLVRKLKLDFRDVFDKGMYFDSLSASVQVSRGVMHTDNYYMKGAAGDLHGRGYTDLLRRWVDYDLEFYPNLTSSLPLVAAFAVTPVTGLYVYALSKILSPVVEVFTKLQFTVEGPLDAPRVEEGRRTRGEVELPNRD